MGKIKPGSKQNAALNGEWAKHVRKDGKKETSGIRRSVDKTIIHKEKKEL